MRILKKSMAITLVVAMVMSLMSFSVFAEATDMTLSAVASKSIVGQGRDMRLELKIKANAESGSFPFGITGTVIAYDKDVWTVTDESTGMLWSPESTTIDDSTGEIILGSNGIGTMSSQGVSLDAGATWSEVVASLVFTAKADATVGDTEISFRDTDFSNNTTYENYSVTAPETITITIAEEATINTVVAPAAIEDKALGTAVDELELPETVVIETATAASAVGQTLDVEWDTTGYDATTLDPQTFEGTVSTDNDFWTLNIAEPVQITVTLQPITDGEIAALDMVKVTVTEVDTEFNLTAYKAIVGDPVQAVITKGDIEDVITINDAWISVTDVNTTSVDTVTEDAVTITIPANTMSDNGKFKIAETVLNGDVKVVPAEIEGCEAKISGTKPTSKPEVTVTLPEGAIDVEGEGEEAVYTGTFELIVTADGGTCTQTFDAADDNIKITKNADESYKVTIKSDVAFKDMETDADDAEGTKLGLDSAGIEFSVGVTYNGSALKFGVGEDAPLTIDSSLAASSTSAGGSNLPTGSVDPVTPEQPVDPEVPVDPEQPVDPETPAVTGPFEDVPGDFWAADYITALKEAGIIGGVSATEFAPNAYITRAEYAKMVANVFGLEAAATESTFVDCPADAWFTPYVAACTEAGYILGVSETEFAPEALITREQACAILGRALNAASETELTFTDAADVDDYAKGYVAALVEMGLVNGYEDGTFAPDNNITRAEAAKIIAGAFASLGEEVPEEEVVEEETTEEVVEETTEEVTEEATEEVAEEVTEEATETEAE